MADLKRVLGAGDATWIVAGNMIGAGIFLTPGLVAGRLPGGLAWPLLAWAAGGLLALAGAAVYAELGARMPEAGGDYRFLAEAFGPVWGFLNGWAALLLTFSAAAAAMALVVMDHLATAVGIAGGAPALLRVSGAALLLLLLTVGNVVGSRAAGRTTMALTALPLLGLFGIFAFGLMRGGATVLHAAPSPASPAASGAGFLLAALGAAMLPVFFTYSGWNAATYVGGEIRDAGRNLPRGLLAGTALVTLVYLTVNAVVLLVVPPAELAGATTAVSLAARRLAGPGAERALSLVIAAAVAGSANVTIMAGARIYFAMGRDGLAPRVLARTNRAGVPGPAVWTSGIWSALLAVTGAVAVLVSLASLAMVVLSSLAVASLFVMRRRRPGPAPFRCPGYPATPLFYLAACAAVAIASLLDDPAGSLGGLALVAAGAPVYVLVRRFARGVRHT